VSGGAWIASIGIALILLMMIALYLLIDHGRKLAHLIQEKHDAADQRGIIKSIVSEIRSEIRVGNEDIKSAIEGERQQYGVLEQKAVSHLLALTIAVNELKAKLARFFGASETPPPSHPKSTQPGNPDKGN
jgi:hypothetical protein